MPGVCRLTDICTGHGCWPPRPNAEASTDTFVNGLGVHRQGDAWKVHTCKTSHAGVLAKGSTTVIVNGKQCGRCGDPVSCGSKVATCSSDTIAGG